MLSPSLLLLPTLLGSLCVEGFAFLPHSFTSRRATYLAATSDKEEKERQPSSFFDITTQWVDDSGATDFLDTIFSDDESSTNVSSIVSDLFSREDSDEDKKGADDGDDSEGIRERIAGFVASDDSDETLLEPYSEGLPDKVEDIILSNGYKTDDEKPEMEQESEEDSDGGKIVEGGPSSLLGKIMGDDETTVSNPSQCNNDDGGDSSSSSSSSKESTSPTGRIQERIAQVVTGQDAKQGDSVKTTSSSDGLLSLARDFKNLLLGGGDEGIMDNLLLNARRRATRDYEDDERSYDDLLRIVNENREAIGATLRDTFSPVDFSKLFPTSLFYYLEFEDERKNPSWKRMKHRFHPGVDVGKVEELNEQLYLAKQSYCDTVDEVGEGLKSAQEPVELVFCDTESFPGRPAHFIAVKKKQPRNGDFLEVLMVVRGTKSITDIITDGLLAPEDYRGGKVHAGFLESGTYLVETHVELLRKLRKMATKDKVKLTLIGHSLGAGACSVAAMELNEFEDIEAKVVGFGCPSLLSKELAESTEDYITTVIADADIVPRLNDITVANAVLDLMEIDWTPKARRDIDHAFQELQRCQPGLMSVLAVDDIMTLVDAGLAKFAKPKLEDPVTERLKPILFPPGTCIHFYRDGAGVSATYTPSSFFDEIDVSRTCMRDHLMVGGYSRIFLRVMRDHDNPNFVFENCLIE